MTGHRQDPAKRQAGKEVLQFAPNSPPYVLPPDVVCLYSEDRKFFLHGELYCALASAIEKRKKLGELVGQLEQDFPSDKINEGSSGCLERRYVVSLSSSSANTVPATV